MAALVCVMFAVKNLSVKMVTIIVEYVNMTFVRNATKFKRSRNKDKMNNQFMVISPTQEKLAKELISVEIKLKSL